MTMVEQQYTCMKDGSGGNLGSGSKYSMKLFGPLFLFMV